VIDVSVSCALGAWMVLSASSLVTADDCLLAGPPRCAWDSDTLTRGSDFK
jgi:hypothetical protein